MPHWKQVPVIHKPLVDGKQKLCIYYAAPPEAQDRATVYCAIGEAWRAGSVGRSTVTESPPALGHHHLNT